MYLSPRFLPAPVELGKFNTARCRVMPHRDGEKFRCQSAATVLQKQPIALLKFASVQTQTTSG
jgi:hypothetical protein